MQDKTVSKIRWGSISDVSQAKEVINAVLTLPVVIVGMVVILIVHSVYYLKIVVAWEMA